MVEMSAKHVSAAVVDGRQQMDEVTEMARILLESIPPDKKQLRTGRVLAYLAEKTMKWDSKASLPRRMPTKDIHTDLEGNPNQEPAAWMSQIWKDIEKQLYPSIKDALIERCRKAGLESYPIVAKYEGKPAYYGLEARKITEEDIGIEQVETLGSASESAIQYERDLTLQLSFVGRLFFREGMNWTPVKRYSFITSQLIYLTAVLIYVTAILLILWGKKTPLSGQDIVMLILGLVVPYLAYRHGIDVWRLFEDRIIIAPDWTIAWKEFGATIEINRSKVPDAPKTIHVNRYSATCPICGWMVKLDKGEPDHPKRIVGRCEENPREHVFSFDRSNKLGQPLMAPMLRK
jgi:hypothetical protein